jgi:hypothetical protein
MKKETFSIDEKIINVLLDLPLTMYYSKEKILKIYII